jgi:hypothetical protein
MAGSDELEKLAKPAAKVELDPSDPLYEEDGIAKAKRHHRIPETREPHARTRWSALANRSNDEIYPQLTRLCLYLQLRTKHGQEPVALTNAALLDFDISRRQKYRLLQRLAKSGRIRVEQEPGCHPVVTVLRPWW